MLRCLSLILLPVVFLYLISPFFNLLAATSSVQTVVVYPLRDGTFDEASLKTAELLRQKMIAMPKLKMIDPQNVQKVLNYYQGYHLSAQTAFVEQAKEYLGRAKDHYFQLDYPTAQAELAKVHSIFQTDPELVFTDGQVWLDSWMTLGLIHAATKQKAKAVQIFAEVFRLNPFYQADPKALAPSIRRLLHEARQGMMAEAQAGRVEIRGEPKVAEVYLNGIYQGVSPLVLDPLPPQEYALTFKANRYQTFKQRLLLKPSETKVIRHKLDWEGIQQKESPKVKLAKRSAIEEGLRIAELLKVDKVLLVDVEAKTIETRLLDRQYRTSHKPLAISADASQPDFEENLAKLARFIFAQTELNLLQNPQAHLDPEGVGDPILLGKRARRIPKGIWIGGLSTLGVGGLLAAILVSASGSSNTGTVGLSFK